MAGVLLGVTGGIAAYKACTLVRLLVRAGHDVYPIITAGAERFVAAETFFALARTTQSGDPYPHLQRADLLVVAPLTANTLARLAHGLADDLLTEAALAHSGPVLVAPAMNSRMWMHPATQANVRVLLSRGVELVGPVEGELAEGEEGIGRMAEPEEILTRVEAILVAGTRTPGSLSGLRVVVSAGGTREPLDAVRYLGNRSSGRMGVALVEEAQRRGADVTLLAANLTVPAPLGITVVETPTAEDLEREALACADADVIVMAAAVADYRLPSPSASKRPKDGAPWVIELAPTTDVLRALGAARRPGQVLVGFAADGADSGLERAREKRRAKRADLFVFNDISRPDIGFDAPDNEVVLISEDGEREVGKAPKSVIAAAILDEAERVLSKR
ncbi:MAG: bifunctional phosphopantothenoylcysteine decarboxylase/phosphopantothenate--cysteine ligase CoaBC [Thermoleophilia bacterium]|nr:bifunctional phosphopantothenoylcysteine decarboxylase/phosphopantothenate--cysteine ligase CoaBC [Thermoleophilia bacterium]MDH4340104.1 bifunctional phosphopantothenoylcysteine decarboxylase/phosphopantothenate--cysteine ligase CoaBC [Thermoleophilia bacterium]MDH5280886.1 bifunctional phosphopantothenoylcysteine decarboxylase/phosphopantothenate--cysteine ligase CoaBC [Thermoleophilia bacterium]